MNFANFNFSEPIFIIPFLTGLTYLAAGWYMNKYPKKEISTTSGYKTQLSMKNQKNWDFAQKYSPLVITKSGLAVLASSLLAFVTEFGEIIGSVIGLAIVIAGAIYPIIKTERAIKEMNELS